MSDRDRPEPSDEELEALVADALVKRGELAPTTESEVRAAERALAEEDEIELPASLAAFRAPPSAPRARVGDAPDAGAVSQRVVSLDEHRRARATGLHWAHAGTFALGAAIAAATLLYVRTPAPDRPLSEPGAGTGPSPSASASASASPRIEIPPVRTCAADCCAGSDCSAAEGELKKCASGRSCVACDVTSDPSNAYRVRIGAIAPTEKLGALDLDAVDLCARVGGGAWACLPARGEPSPQPDLRALPKLASMSDLSNGVELELRVRGQKQALGRWRDSVRMSPTLLCRGAGALLADEKGEHLGSVALLVDETHFVEIGRSAEVSDLEARARSFVLGDVTAQIVETKAGGGDRFALTMGPFDKGTAERLRWAFLEKRQQATVVLGDDYAGSPRLLK